MQIMNTAPGPRSVLSIGLKLRPGQVATVDDEAWAKAKQSPVVQAWLAAGELKEVSASAANAAVAAAAAKAPKPAAKKSEAVAGGAA